jgi:hypothetical protein
MQNLNLVVYSLREGSWFEMPNIYACICVAKQITIEISYVIPMTLTITIHHWINKSYAILLLNKNCP